MQDVTKFVGLDVSKDTVAVAIAEEGRDAPRYYGQILNTPEAIRNLIFKLNETDCRIRACYEAGPTGYGLHRFLTALGVECSVVAPSLIPKRAGDRIKTDRRDALRLSQLYRAGELTPIYIPTENDEALRDLVRAREVVKSDQLRARHHLAKFLLRHEITPPSHIKRKWTKIYHKWLDTLKFDILAMKIVFEEYVHTLVEIELRLERLDQAIHSEAITSEHAPIIEALQTLRGVKETTAVTLVAEVGTFKRFANPRDFMGYTGLIPSEYSSGASRKQGSITKTGNTHIRRILVEAAWSYRHQPGLKGDILKRQEGQDPAVQRQAWKAQTRLHLKYTRMAAKGKPQGKVTTAVARELAGFVWAIAMGIESCNQHVA